jgi:hypothetical protein
MPQDGTFAGNVISAYMRGVQLAEQEHDAKRRRQAEDEDRAFQKQLREHQIKKLKWENEAAEIEAGLQRRQIQGMTSGGPTGQAAVVTPTYQLPAQAPVSIEKPQIDPSTATSIQELLMKIRRHPVAAQPMPIQGMSQSVETGLPPAYPDIDVPGLGVKIPGTNREIEQARQANAERMKVLNTPYELSPGQSRYLGNERLATAPPKEPEPPAVIQELRAFRPDWDQLTDDDKLKVFGSYMTAKQAQGPVAGRDMPLPPEVEAQRVRISGANRAASTGTNSNLVQAVLSNPTLYDDLTPTVKARIAPDLATMGFTGFGKKLAESAITKLSDARAAIASLHDLREVLTANEQYIGPLAGLQALNPYSEGRKAQAEIDRVRQRVGKALEGGVLRAEDETKYKRILATLTDTPETAIYKLDSLVNALEQDINIFLEEQRRAGRNTGGTGGPTTVRMKAPNGQVQDVPADMVPHYKNLGAVEVR